MIFVSLLRQTTHIPNNVYTSPEDAKKHRQNVDALNYLAYSIERDSRITVTLI